MVLVWVYSGANTTRVTRLNDVNVADDISLLAKRRDTLHRK